MKGCIITVVALVLVSSLSASQQRTGPSSAGNAGLGNPGASGPGAKAVAARRACIASIRDQANPGACLLASSVPTPGMLFPGPHTGGVNNVQSGTDSFVGGGERNTASGVVAAVGGGSDNTASGSWSTVAGGGYNQASGHGSTVCGGSYNVAAQLEDGFAFVGGGIDNGATGDFSAVMGGLGNRATRGWAAVGGGSNNEASGTQATVAGGGSNSAVGQLAAVGGGENSASGYAAVSPGGRLNSATGDFSFAAGRRAQAIHAGAFVWGDGQNADKHSSGANEFSVFCSGGARFVSDAAQTTGVSLAPGSGSWASLSDREAKENFAPVDAREALARVAALPLATWNYRAQDDSVRHMGPTAQDFRAAFGLGASEKAIDTVDADGVALAAIQGLNELLRESESEVAHLSAENHALAERVARLEALVTGLACPPGAGASPTLR